MQLKWEVYRAEILEPVLNYEVKHDDIVSLQWVEGLDFQSGVFHRTLKHEEIPNI